MTIDAHFAIQAMKAGLRGEPLPAMGDGTSPERTALVNLIYEAARKEAQLLAGKALA